jgi:hypothetical protein
MTQPLKVNFSSNEASSEARVIPPTGEYTVNITDGNIKEVKPGKKNTGKPFWQLTYVIQEGPYDGVSLMSSIMLFDGALYSFAQLMKALGYDVNAGDFVVPDLQEIIGKTINVKGTKKPAETKDGQELNERFEIRYYKSAGKPVVSSASNSLLP